MLAKFDLTTMRREFLSNCAEQQQTHEKHAVDVVDITVLPTSIMKVIARHADLRSVEDGRLREGNC